MVAFCRTYKLKNTDDNGKEKEFEYFDIYTSEINYFFQKTGRNWEQISTSQNLNKKIPVI